MTEYYKDCLEKGLEFQDFVAELLLKELGIPLTAFSSRKYQFSNGENAQGFEIKFDDKYKSTGNIYIEVSEKSNAENKEYIESGIYRHDNTWLYLIGDYSEVYVFSKKWLLGLHKTKRYREVTTPTSNGFLIPKEDAVKYAVKIIKVKGL